MLIVHLVGFRIGALEMFKEVFVRLIWCGFLDLDDAIEVADMIRNKPSESNKGEGVQITLDMIEEIRKRIKVVR